MTQSQVLSKASPYGGATCSILQRRVLRHFSHKSSQQIVNTEWQVYENQLRHYSPYYHHQVAAAAIDILWSKGTTQFSSVNP